MSWLPTSMYGPLRRVYTRTRKIGAKLLGSLASALRAIPARAARDTLLLAGDFNAQLHASQNLVGRSSTPRENTGVRDESFQRFVESHRLVALNTWSSGRGHTYVQGDARTQIDYIFTFPNSSRGQAKQAKPAPQLGLGGWKKGGHLPILATVRPVRHWNLPKESRRAPSYCASSLEAAVRAHSTQAQAMQTWVDSQLQSAALPPDSINSVLMQGAERFFPKKTSIVKPLNAAHRATLRMWQRLQHINADAASSTLTDADASQLREDLQAGCHPCTQEAASPGIPGRSGRGLQKRRRLPGPQDPEKAPPMGTPNTGTAAKLRGLTSHTTGRVDHAGDARYKDFCAKYPQ